MNQKHTQFSKLKTSTNEYGRLLVKAQIKVLFEFDLI